MDEELKKLITEAKNICLIPSKGPESLTSALALFYTLKESGKNVNCIINELPSHLYFLAPSLDLLQTPKNLILSIPQKSGTVSQLYYEKTIEGLMIHLTMESGNIKKDDIEFYFKEPKPDAVITIGIGDFQGFLERELDAYGYLLTCPLINIDQERSENRKFGRHNILDNKFLTEVVVDFIRSLPLEQQLSPKAAQCLFTGLVLGSDNFKAKQVTASTFQTAALLLEKGADHRSANEPSPSHQETEPSKAPQNIIEAIQGSL